MLLSFRCTNFRSIRDGQEFSLVAAKTRSPEKPETLLASPIKGVDVLRCAGLYGANASGKSNILKALRQMSRMVSQSQRKWDPTNDIPDWDPFRLDDESDLRETEFSIDFVLDGRAYNYGFSYTLSSFRNEWLTDTTAKDKGLFRRSSSDSVMKFEFPGRNLLASADQNKLLDIAKLQTRNNSLFLSSAAQSNHDFLSNIYKWITERFHIITPTTSSAHSYTAESSASGDRKQRIIKLLQAADIGILDFKIAVEEYPEDSKKMFAAMMKAIRETAPATSDALTDTPPSRQDITMLHQGFGTKAYPLPFSSESAGTRAYFNLLGPILDELADGSVLLIDELESSLHPSLTKQLVAMFNDPVLNPKGAQLIFSSHDTTLLDLSLLRRDQFWFTDKDSRGVTTLIPLSDYKMRAQQDLSKAYLQGKFAGTPLISGGLVREALIEEGPILVEGENLGER